MASSEEQPPQAGEYRAFLPDLSIGRFTTMQKQDAREYAEAFKTGGQPPWLHALYLHWLELLKEPFKGVTKDGNVQPVLFRLQDEGIPGDEIAAAARAALAALTPEQRARAAQYHIDSPEWRTWSNPEFLLSDKGVRLDEITPAARDAVMLVLKRTLSPEGYAKAVGAMRVNGFLGELVGAPAVMNEFSYNFALFGVDASNSNSPSADRPWGFSFYGHHLCLNIFLYREQIVLSPWFAGAEPNLIDAGPHAGTRILAEEERLGLKLMQSLPPEQQARARVYAELRDPAMPPGRWNHDDQRHLCGAYRDNRVVPYEGLLVGHMDPAQQSLVIQILEQYFLFLPAKARRMRLQSAHKWFRETYFCWIGGFGDDDAFYYRLQSPVLIAEFDHHSGVFLTNKEPAKFHIHTLLRTPNGGDYGMVLRNLIPGSVKQEFVWEGEA